MRPQAIRDRVIELRRVPARDLIANPENWRRHPESQRKALRGVLDEVGFAGALLARETPDGLVLIDGHLRAETTPEQEIPVLVLDVNEDEARKILLTHDPIAAMAETDDAMLRGLLESVESDNEAVNALLESLISREPLDGEDTSRGTSDGGPTYTSKIEAPIYEPKGKRPAVSELTNRDKTDALLAEIKAANLPREIAEFLTMAAERHTVFDFARIAEFYCHAEPGVQALMEKSALVIIDFDAAIENGFVRLTDRLSDIADVEGWNGDEE